MKQIETWTVSDEAWDVLTVESLMISFKTGQRKATPWEGEKEEVWRQHYVKHLTAAMLTLAEHLSEGAKREVFKSCNSSVLREAVGTIG